MVRISTGIWGDRVERPADLQFPKQIAFDCVGYMRGILPGMQAG